MDKKERRTNPRSKSGVYPRSKYEEKDYPCVWYDSIICPIRTKWKLSPENLKLWCEICPLLYLHKETTLRNNSDKKKKKR